jgi:hypothetical protein
VIELADAGSAPRSRTRARDTNTSFFIAILLSLEREIDSVTLTQSTFCDGGFIDVLKVNKPKAMINPLCGHHLLNFVTTMLPTNKKP